MMASITSTPLINKQGSVLFDSMTHLVPPGHEKPLKQALYTSAAMLFVAVGCGAATYVYFVLEIFIRPLLWALLCGSFLFPFKYSLNMVLESWLKSNEEYGRPFIVGAALVPLSLFDGFAESVGNFVAERWKAIAAVAGTLAVLYVLHLVQLLSVFYVVFLAMYQTVVFLWNSTSIALEICAQNRIFIMTLVGAYFIIALMMDPRTTHYLEYFATPAWILLLISFVSIAGSLRVPFGIALAILVITGVISAKKVSGRRLTQSFLQRTSSITALLSPSKETEPPPVEDISEESITDDETKENLVEEEKQDEDVIDGDSISTEESTENPAGPGIHAVHPPASAGSIRGLKRQRRIREGANPRKIHVAKKNSSSRLFFNLLFAAFGLVMLWIHIWLITLLVIPLLYYTIKQLLYNDTVHRFLESRCGAVFGHDIENLKKRTSSFLKSRSNLLVPASVRRMADFVRKGDKKFSSVLLQILPTMTSIFMILTLIFGSVFISVFFAVKIQQESFLMVQMTSDLINETVSQHPEYQSWLPDNDTMQKSMDSLVDNVYSQGREWIKQQVQNNLGTDANVSLVERQALKIWDRAYHSWFNKTAANERKLARRPTHSDLSSPSDSSGGLFSGIVDLLNMSEVIALLKENMSALMSVLESLWFVLQSNATLVISSVTSVLTILLNGGTAILNFVLSMVIFFTTLFYLLAASDQHYIPIEWIGFGGSSSAKPSPIATAIQDAISGVFGASLKMAGFYGLYTWLNHTTFGAILVYVPSMLAAIFSVVPIFTTYWSCFPAFFEIWLLQGDFLRALTLMFFQFLPTMFVDAAIYSEMAESGGGHPYITGLAVAGGLYYFGLEGAIIGPILLCILLVGVNIYYRIMRLPVVASPTQARLVHAGPLFKR